MDNVLCLFPALQLLSVLRGVYVLFAKTFFSQSKKQNFLVLEIYIYVYICIRRIDMKTSSCQYESIHLYLNLRDWSVIFS